MTIGIAEPRRKRQNTGDGELCGSCGAGSEDFSRALRGEKPEGVLSGKTDGKTGQTGQTGRTGRTRQTAPTPAKPVWGDLVRVRVDNCVAHPANRQHAAEDVAARAESLRETGQLEPVKVWLQPERTQLVIGGWGRVLAARKLKLAELEARPLLGMLRDGQTVPPTQAELLGLLAEDNSQRTELTVLERAELGDRLMEAGWSEEQAARRVGFRQRGSLSNARKLLKLPEPIRRRVTLPESDPQYLPQAVARRIADYAHVPEIVAEIDSDYTAEPEEWRENGNGSTIGAECSVEYCIRRAVRPMDAAAVEALAYNRAVPAGVEALPVTRIPVVVDGERTEIAVTTDVAAWDAAANARPKGVASDDDDERPARATKPALTPEAKRAEARQKAEQLQKRRDRWEYRWRHAFVCRRLQEEDVRPIQHAFWRALLWAIAETHPTGRTKLAAAVEASGCAKGLTRRYSSAAECVSYLPSDEAVLYQTVIDLVRSLVAEPETGNPDFPHVPRELVWSLCADLGFEPATEWEALHHSEPGRQLQRDLWESHETAQLQKVVSELPGVACFGDKKRDLVESLIAGEIALPLWLRPATTKKGKGKK
jgi:ParB-like chromosome segregation protein Spo0J